ncbi:MAG TPA: tetratricopeptide repeat protein [Terriglobales bacterium]|nr:tetratricopeptide repeat protein [Terriglobales bacterium]
MKKLILIMVVVMLASLRGFGAEAAAADPQTSMASMSAPELESQGDALRAQRDFPEAIRYYQAALKKDPKNSQLFNKIGITELKRGNEGVAEVNFQKAVKVNAKNADALNNIGVVAFFHKNYGKSVKFYKRALAVDETNATYHSNLGTAWFTQNKLDRAMAEYARAMELDPEVFLRSNQGGASARVSTMDDRAKYEFVLAKLYAQRGDWDRCFQWLAKAKEDGYHDIKDVYKDPEFAKVRQDPRLAQIVPPPAAAGY